MTTFKAFDSRNDTEVTWISVLGYTEAKFKSFVPSWGTLESNSRIGKRKYIHHICTILSPY